MRRLVGPRELLTPTSRALQQGQPGVGLRSVYRSYGAVCAVSNVSIDVPVGVTVLLGRNGAGKSTLARVLVGVERPDTGHLLRTGNLVHGARDLRDHLGRTGWLPQSFSAPGTLTACQYVAYAGWLKNLSGQALRAAVEQALRATDCLDLRKRRLAQLSGGMLRRVGIAQAIVHQPDLLVLDEPTAGLDPEQRGAFHTLLGQLASDRSVLLSTHLLEDVAAIGERTIILDQGSVRFDGSTEQLMSHGTGSDSSERLRSGFLSVLSTTSG